MALSVEQVAAELFDKAQQTKGKLWVGLGGVCKDVLL